LNPLPVLLVRRGAVGARALGALQRDPRLEVFTADNLTPEWVSFSQRVAATIVATGQDPLSALGWVVTAGLNGPVVMAVSPRHKGRANDLIEAGAIACVLLPVTARDVGTLVPLLVKHAAIAHIDNTLRLLFDPIGRMVRYRDRSVRLSQREFAVLHCLSTYGGRPVSADQLLRIVWGGEDAGAGERSRQILDVYIHQLRKKLDRLGLRGAIATMRGFGYALVQVAQERTAG